MKRFDLGAETRFSHGESNLLRGVRLDQFTQQLLPFPMNIKKFALKVGFEQPMNLLWIRHCSCIIESTVCQVYNQRLTLLLNLA